jgi:hypothetical protein
MRAIQRTDEGDRSERRRRVSTLVFFGLIAAATANIFEPFFDDHKRAAPDKSRRHKNQLGGDPLVYGTWL